MSRPSKDKLLMREMCARLSAMLDSTRISDSEISRLLGYATPATLARMRRGEVFPDSERLATLGRLKICAGACPNIHWVLTGQGPPLVDHHKNKQIEALEILIRQATKDSILITGQQPPGREAVTQWAANTRS